eukprot:3419830-Pyramimonas_sp.AAC.1
MEELFCTLAEGWMVFAINTHTFGGVYLQLVQLLMHEKSRKPALKALTANLAREEWKQAHLAWIAAQPETHVSALLYFMNFMMSFKESEVEMVPLVTQLIKLHSTKTGMLKICDKACAKYHEKVYAVQRNNLRILMEKQNALHRDRHAQDLRRVPRQVPRENVVFKSLVIMTCLTLDLKVG